MNVFYYDKTLEGLLNVIFEAYRLKVFPDALLAGGDPAPLLTEKIVQVTAVEAKTNRVWNGLSKKLSSLALSNLIYVWLTEENGADLLIVRYVHKIFSGVSETDFADPDILAMRQTAFKVSREKLHLIEFIRFQKTVDGLYFAPVAPLYNVLPLILNHFFDRFARQRWTIYDLKRDYGYYYNLKNISEIHLDRRAAGLGVKLAEECLAEDEKLFQDLWKTYFQAVAIEERANPKLQKQFMPKRFWPFLTEDPGGGNKV